MNEGTKEASSNLNIKIQKIYFFKSQKINQTKNFLKK